MADKTIPTFKILRGSVGIGTNTPISLLDVTMVNSRRFLVNYDDSLITIKGGNNSGNPENLRLVADKLYFNTGTTGSGSEKMRIQADGKVGIGTTTPSSKLHVYGNDTVSSLPNIAAQFSATGTGGLAIGDENGTDPYLGLLVATDSFHIKTGGNNTRLTIKSDGKVGIGTTAPGKLLTLSSANAQLMLNESDQSSGSQNWLFNAEGGTLYFQTLGGTAGSVSSGSTWMQVVRSGTAISSVSIPSGNVGIGTTDPGAVRLYVLTPNSGNLAAEFRNSHATGSYGVVIKAGSSSSNYSLDCRDKDSNVLMRVRGDGNVGIGTTAPGAKLEVNGNVSLTSAGQKFTFDATSASDNNALYRYSTDGSTYLTSPVDIAFGSGDMASEYVRIKSSGNVGIGLTDPGAVLEVTGNTNKLGIIRMVQRVSGAAAYGLDMGLDPTTGDSVFSRIVNNTVSESFRIQRSSGNVGIGTTAPAYKLDVNGGMRVLNGDVGIGGTPVNSPLNVFSDGGANCIRMIGRANGTTDESCLSFMDNNNSTENCLILNVGKDLAFHTNSAERMRLNSSGNLGIGTDSPGAKLEIDSGIASAVISNGDNQTAADGLILKFTTGADSRNFGIKFQGGSTYTYARIRGGTYPYGPDTGFISFETAAGGLGLYNNLYERFRITGSGNVGIGTDGPTEKVHIWGAGTQVLAIQGDGGSGPKFTIRAGGTLTFSNDNTPYMNLNASGRFTLNTYGSGTHTGTAAYKLSVTSGGIVIETPIGAGAVDGAGTANYISKWTDGDTIGNSLIYDDGTNDVGIGVVPIAVNTSHKSLQLGGNFNLQSYGTQGAGGEVDFCHNVYLNQDGNYKLISADEGTMYRQGSGKHSFYSWASGNANSNVSVSGPKFEISAAGAATFSGALTGTTATFSGGSVGWYNAASIRGHLGMTGNEGDLSIYRSSAVKHVYLSSYYDCYINPAIGNVGIGTTSPAADLHVYGGSSGGTVSSNSNIIAIESNTNNGLQFLNPSANNANINFGDNNANEIGFIQYQHATDKMNFRAGGTTIMTLVGGRVGIGTTGPTATLHVSDSGTTDADGYSLAKADADAQSLRTYHDGTTWVIAPKYGTQGGLSDLFIKASTGNAVGLLINRSTGNIGIGTSDAPLALVHTQKRAAHNLTYLDTFSATNAHGSNLYFRKSDNNTGGTKTQTDDGDNLGTLGFYGVHTGGDWGVSAAINVSQQGASGGTYVPSHISFATCTASAYAEKMRILPDGNVGIGTTAPSNKLTIAGTGSADHLHLYGSGTNGIKFTFNGTNYVSYIRTFEAGTQADNYMSFGVSTGNNTTSVEAMRLTGDGYTVKSRTVQGLQDGGACYSFNLNSGTGGTGNVRLTGSGQSNSALGLDTWAGADGTTIAMWIKPNGTPTEWDGLYSNTTGSTGTQFGFGASGLLRIASDSGNPQVNSTTAVTANEWNHVVVSYSGSTITFYINGVNAGGGGSYTPQAPSTTDFAIGQYYGGAQQASYKFDGQIRQLQHFPLALTAGEIAQLYSGENPKKNLDAPELTTNGTFDSDANWTKGAGWTISGGEAIATNTNTWLYQSKGVVVGKTYKLTITCSNFTDGSVAPFIYGGVAGTVTGTALTSTGTQSLVFKNLDTTIYVGAVPGSNSDVRVDNISFVEVGTLVDFNSRSAASGTWYNQALPDLFNGIVSNTTSPSKGVTLSAGSTDHYVGGDLQVKDKLSVGDLNVPKLFTGTVNQQIVIPRDQHLAGVNFNGNGTIKLIGTASDRVKISDQGTFTIMGGTVSFGNNWSDYGGTNNVATMANNKFFAAINNPASANIQLIGLNASNQVSLGPGGGGVVAAGNVGIGTTTLITVSARSSLTISTASEKAELHLQTRTATTSSEAGILTFYNNTQRIGAIQCSADGATNSGKLTFYSWNAGSVVTSTLDKSGILTTPYMIATNSIASGGCNPRTDNAHDLGNGSYRWRNLFLSNLLTANSITVGGNLDVAQSIRHTGDTSTAISFEGSQISIGTSGGCFMSFNNDEALYFYTSTSTTLALTLDTSQKALFTGNVDVAQSKYLRVGGSTSTAPFSARQVSGSSMVHLMELNTGTSAQAWSFGLDTVGNYVDFVVQSEYSAGSWGEKFRITKQYGCVGIGTTAPAGLLHVYETSSNQKSWYFDNHGTGAAQLNVRQGSGNLYLSLNRTDTYGSINIATQPFYIKHYHGAWVETFSINTSGQVGINKSNAGYMLDVNGTFATSGACTLATDASTSTFGGCVGIGVNPGYMLQVNGSFAATSKSFVIDHPIKPDYMLEYGALEGPEFGVYHRGRAESDTITLPDYWSGLVRDGTLTVQLTPNGSFQHLYVVSTSLSEIKIGAAEGETIDCYYTIYGERADLDPLVVEKIV